MLKDVVFWLVWAITIIAWLFLAVQKSQRNWAMATLILKVCLGWLVGMVYAYYYTSVYGDTFRFFDRMGDWHRLVLHYPNEIFNMYLTPERYYDFFNNSEWRAMPRMVFFVKMMYPIYLLSGGSYALVSAWLSFFCVIGISIFISKTFTFISLPLSWLWIIFGWIPTFAFWSSGLLKETVTYPVILICVSIVYQSRFQWLSLIWVLVLSYFLLQLKFYFFVALWLWIAIAFFSNSSISLRLKWVGVLGFSFIALGAIISIPQLNLATIMEEIVLNQSVTIRESKKSEYSGFYIHFITEGPVHVQWFLNVCWALFSGWFRPFIGESRQWTMWPTMIQNVVILVLTMGKCLGYIYLTKNSKSNHVLNPTFWWGASGFVLILSILLPIASPNFGTLERYKSIYMPFLVAYLCLNNFWIEKLRQRSQGIKMT